MAVVGAVLERRMFAAKERIFLEGDIGDAAYLVDSGRVAIYKTVEGGGRVVLASLVKGAIFGEMAMVDEAPRMASAMAVETTVLVAIPRTLFKRKMDEMDPFVQALFGMLVENLRGVHKVYMARPRTTFDLGRTQKDLLATAEKIRAAAADASSVPSDKSLDLMKALAASLEADAARGGQDRRCDALASGDAAKPGGETDAKTGGNPSKVAAALKT